MVRDMGGIGALSLIRELELRLRFYRANSATIMYHVILKLRIGGASFLCSTAGNLPLFKLSWRHVADDWLKKSMIYPRKDFDDFHFEISLILNVNI